jgi:hypothetical protein
MTTTLLRVINSLLPPSTRASVSSSRVFCFQQFAAISATASSTCHSTRSTPLRRPAHRSHHLRCVLQSRARLPTSPLRLRVAIPRQLLAHRSAWAHIHRAYSTRPPCGPESVEASFPHARTVSTAQTPRSMLAWERASPHRLATLSRRHLVLPPPRLATISLPSHCLARRPCVTRGGLCCFRTSPLALAPRRGFVQRICACAFARGCVHSTSLCVLGPGNRHRAHQ